MPHPFVTNRVRWFEIVPGTGEVFVTWHPVEVGWLTDLLKESRKERNTYERRRDRAAKKAGVL